MSARPLIERYAKDICATVLRLARTAQQLAQGRAPVVACVFRGGFTVVALSGGSLAEAAQFGLSLFVWGAVLRTVVVWHITWSVNSATHVWGYRNYNTPDVSRNNMLIALLTCGEGWHNNHHADSRSARHGHKWWELT